MNLYHATGPSAAQRVLAHGFRPDENGRPDAPVNVLLSDQAPPANGRATILLDLPEDVVDPFELRGQGAGGREFLVPADLVDRFPVLAVRGVDGNGAVVVPERGVARRRPFALAGLLALVLAAGAAALAVFVLDDEGGRSKAPDRAAANRPQTAPAAPAREAAPSAPESRAIGRTNSGRLVGGVPLPRAGRHFFTWDAVKEVSPNPRWRRYGTAATVESTLEVLERYARAHPDAPRVGIADLSRRRGGDFGVQFGGRGHSSHQNGLDVDVLYPRRDGRERSADFVDEVDRRLAQDLVDRFIRAGARVVYVDTRLGLTGPRRIVRSLGYHDDHMHVRFPKR